MNMAGYLMNPDGSIQLSEETLAEWQGVAFRPQDRAEDCAFLWACGIQVEEDLFQGTAR
jgi:hypothetical protein